MITIDLANDENDDWLKKANPNYRKSEAKAHAGADLLHKQAITEQTKELADYAVLLPGFEPGQVPSAEVLSAMVDNMQLLGLSWPEEVKLFKDAHQFVDGDWVIDA